jgi:hypothetical protein
LGQTLEKENKKIPLKKAKKTKAKKEENGERGERGRGKKIH